MPFNRNILWNIKNYFYWNTDHVVCVCSCTAGAWPLARAAAAVVSLDVRYVSSVSETWLDTRVYPVYLTVTRLLAMLCVSSVSETRPDTQCIWCIQRPPSVYLTSRLLLRNYCVAKNPCCTYTWADERRRGRTPQSPRYDLAIQDE